MTSLASFFGFMISAYHRHLGAGRSSFGFLREIRDDCGLKESGS